MARDLYQEVTNTIIKSLENGVAPWVRPWRVSARFGGLPYNASIGKPYRGVNVLLLGIVGQQYPIAGWMTYKQATDLGANVRRGEKGTMIVFYKPYQVRDRNAEPGDERMKTIPLLRAYHVFNVAQIDNLPAKFSPQPDERPEQERHDIAEKLLTQAVVKHGGDRAFYVPSRDYIQLPVANTFADQGAYYATALHELTHWTGHESRLAREYGKRFGDSAYAREELVAEMGAAFLCAFCGVEGHLQHPEYIGHWLGVLREDKRAVLLASSAAQKAADLVTGAVEEPEEVEVAEAAA